MLKIIGGVVVYGFALFGFSQYLRRVEEATERR